MKHRQDDPVAACLGVSATLLVSQSWVKDKTIRKNSVLVRRNLGMIVATWIIYLYDTIAQLSISEKVVWDEMLWEWVTFVSHGGGGGLSIHRHARRFHQCLSPLLRHLVFWAGWFCIILLFSVEMICLILNFIALKNLYVIDASRLN